MPPVARNKSLDPIREPLEGKTLSDVRNRLKTARGHVDHILGMLDEGAYAIDVLRQVAAVRGALDATARTTLRYYFEHLFANAVKRGQTKAASDELMSALSFLRQIE